MWGRPICCISDRLPCGTSGIAPLVELGEVSIFHVVRQGEEAVPEVTLNAQCTLHVLGIWVLTGSMVGVVFLQERQDT